jgi:hypothetical protein
VNPLRRVIGVAGLRAREGLRGPVLWFHILFAALAIVAALASPGEAGVDRQRAVDTFVLNAALFVSILAAAAIGSASLPGDREAGRESILRASAIREHELLIGGLLGNAACLLVLLFGMYLATISVTGLLAGGDRDRAATRTALRADRLTDYQGRAVVGRWLSLPTDASFGTYTLPATAEELEPGEDAQVFIDLREMVVDLGAGIPEVYPVAVRVGDGPERIIRNRTGNPLEFTVQREELADSGGTEIEVRRIDPAFLLGISPGGLLVQGAIRSLPVNLLRAFASWFLGLLVVMAGANAMSVLVGAPVAAAGTMLIALLGRSHDLLAESAEHLKQAVPTADLARGLIETVSAVVPDLLAYDLITQVTTRWAIEFPVLLGRGLAAVTGAGAFLLLALVFRAFRRLA